MIVTFAFVCPGLQPDDSGDSRGQTDTVELAESEAGLAVMTAEEGLSHRSLVLRRALALAFMLLILAAGIIVNVLITNLVT